MPSQHDRQTGAWAPGLQGCHQGLALPLQHGAEEVAKMMGDANIYIFFWLRPRINHHQILFMLLKLRCPHFLIWNQISEKVNFNFFLLCWKAEVARGRKLFWELHQQGRSRREAGKPHCWEASVQIGFSYLLHFLSFPRQTTSLMILHWEVLCHSACGRRSLESL